MQEKEIYEDEIDLKELIKTILKHKKFIVIFTCIVTFLAIIYLLLKTPIYEIKSNIQIGYIGENLLDEPKTIVQKLNLIFDTKGELVKKDSKFVSKVSSITQDKNLKNFIEIKTEGISNDAALEKTKEVISYLQLEYENKIQLYKIETNNSITDKLNEIQNLQNLEAKNIKEEIEKLKNTNIAKLDNDIKILKTQNIVSLENERDILIKQNIPAIKKQIDFYNKNELISIDNKIKFHTQKLSEYEHSISKIYNNSKAIKDNLSTSISTMQMLNYQNLILDSQNKIENLKLEKEQILLQSIPKLQDEIKNINTVSIKNIDNKIKNIKEFQILSLEKQKENIINENIRKLQYSLDVTLPNKKTKLNQEIEKLKYNISPLNIQNSKNVGEYIIKDGPTKPKKKLIIAVAFVTSFILSIFLVFFMEFIKGLKEEGQ